MPTGKLRAIFTEQSLKILKTKNYREGSSLDIISQKYHLCAVPVGSLWWPWSIFLQGSLKRSKIQALCYGSSSIKAREPAFWSAF